MRSHLLLAGGAIFAATPALAQEAAPDAIVRMIDAAYASGDEATIKSTVELAKKTNPTAAAAIDAQAKALADKMEAERLKKFAEAGMFDLWKGEAELGADLETGNTDSLSFGARARIERDGLKWRHKLNGLVDYEETDDRKSKERYFAGYDLNYKLTPRLYVVGTLSWESDVFAGFDNRFIESLGLGYTIVDRPRLRWSVEGGVAGRQTDYTVGANDVSIVGRAATDLDWHFSPNATLSERIEVYAGGRSTTLESITSLTAKMFGALAARLSYDVKHETDPPAGRDATDTTARAALVYDF